MRVWDLFLFSGMKEEGDVLYWLAVFLSVFFTRQIQMYLSLLRLAEQKHLNELLKCVAKLHTKSRHSRN